MLPRTSKYSSTNENIVLTMDIEELDPIVANIRKTPKRIPEIYSPEKNNISGTNYEEGTIIELPVGTSVNSFSLPPYDFQYLDVISQIPLGNSTFLFDEKVDIKEKFIKICNEASEENFEDGIESEFSKSLINFIKDFKDNAIISIKDLINEDKINHEVVSETLRWFGLIEHAYTYESRLSVLEECLFNPSLYIRDGALLGISFLDNPSALPYLREAFRLEKCSELKNEIKVIIEQLEET